MRTPSQESLALQYRNVTQKFGETVAVSDFSLDIYEGEKMVLIGPSGCGKTTALKLANGLLQPTQGFVEVFGRLLSDWPLVELRRSIGFVVQETGLFPHMTVAQNIGLLARLEGWKKPKIEDRVNELLELVGLHQGRFHQMYPRQLSGGQAQRVGVARALMLSPRLILMDEPFGALDPITRRQMQTEFRAIEDRVQTTILLVTHDMNEAYRLGDRIAVMEKGRLVQVGNREELREKPKAPFVREFFAAASGHPG